MGTRSTTTFINKYPDSGEVCLVKIYEQYDGYPSGVGKKLCNFILGKKIINGISSDQFTDEFANGFDDLATMYIAEFKKGVGYFHLTDPTLDRSSNKWCDYNYEVVYNYTLELPHEGMPANDLIIIRVFCWDSNDPIFEGSPQEMMNFIDKYDDDES